MPRLRRLLVVLAKLGLAFVVLVAAFVAITALTAPGRFGLEGAEARAREWQSGPPLRDLADRLGVRFGSAVMVRDMRNDPEYSPILSREFNSVTPFVDMKWGSLHPEPDRYDFDKADELVAFAEAHDMRVRGHALVYGHAGDPPNPEYLSGMTDPDVLRESMAEHIRTVAGRYAERVGAWDVVNEPLILFGDFSKNDGISQHVFSRLLGPGYIAEAFQLAREADPDAQLFINDAGVLAPGPKQERYYRLVEELLESGAPLDGVGFQGHVVPLFGTPSPTQHQVEATLKRFAALGVVVEITELNVFTRKLTQVLALGLTRDETAELRKQGEIYSDVTQACLNVPACQGVTLWTFTDRYPTTIETFTRLEDIPLIFDNDYNAKPAAFSLRQTLASATPRVQEPPGDPE